MIPDSCMGYSVIHDLYTLLFWFMEDPYHNRTCFNIRRKLEQRFSMSVDFGKLMDKGCTKRSMIEETGAQTQQWVIPS